MGGKSASSPPPPSSSRTNVKFFEVLLWGQVPTVWGVAMTDIAADAELFGEYGPRHWTGMDAVSSDRRLLDAYYHKARGILDGHASRFPITLA
jgi:hypothetical protein